MIFTKGKLLVTLGLLFWGTLNLTAQLNCEENEARLDSISNLVLNQNNSNDLLIIIARAGDGEKSLETIRRRLYNAKEYLLLRPSVSRDKIITAIGDKSAGYGQVEFYLGGKLFERLLVSKNGSLCVECCGDKLIKPYKSAQMAKPKKRKSNEMSKRHPVNHRKK